MSEGELPSAEALSLEQKVGQLFHVGFVGTEATSTIRSLITEYHVGGVIYFRRNTRTRAQTHALTRALQQEAKEYSPAIPLLISVDQEGGPVTRFPFFPEVPSQMGVRATGDRSAAATVAEITAEQLRSVGVNWNLAPVLDVNSNPKNPVIGPRSYGESPETVAEFASAYISTIQSNGIAACGKHFPGHGDTETDSHEELPVVDADTSRLERIELPPFERAISEGVEAIMASHVAYPAVTGSRTQPASTSKRILTDWLRTDLGFDGLIATDCLEMDAITETVGTPRGAVQSVHAGADAVFVSHTPDVQRASIEAVIDAVRDGRISDDRIDNAYRRVRAVKQRCDIRPPVSTGGSSEERHRREIRSLAHQAATVVSDESDRLPLDGTDPLVLVVPTQSDESRVAEERGYPDVLSDALASCGFETTVIEASPSTAAVSERIPANAQVVCCTVNTGRNPSQAVVVRTLLDDGHDPIVIALSSPYDIQGLPPIRTYLTTYDTTPSSLRAVAAVMAGDVSDHGTVLPSLR